MEMVDGIFFAAMALVCLGCFVLSCLAGYWLAIGKWVRSFVTITMIIGSLGRYASSDDDSLMLAYVLFHIFGFTFFVVLITVWIAANFGSDRK
jgi:hypothetical protein